MVEVAELQQSIIRQCIVYATMTLASGYDDYVVNKYRPPDRIHPTFFRPRELFTESIGAAEGG